MPGRMLAGGRRRGAAPKPPAPAPAPAPPPAADLDADPVPEQQSPVAARTSKVQFAAKQPTPREVPANATKKKVVLLDSDDESDAMSVGTDVTGTTDTSGDDLLAELGIASHASMGLAKKKKKISPKKSNRGDLRRTKTAPDGRKQRPPQAAGARTSPSAARSPSQETEPSPLKLEPAEPEPEPEPQPQPQPQPGPQPEPEPEPETKLQLRVVADSAQPQPEPEMESDVFGLQPFGVKQEAAPAGSPQAKESQKPSAQKVAEWLDDAGHSVDDDAIEVQWHAEGGEDEGNDGAAQKEGQFNAYFARVKNHSEAMSVLEEFCDMHRENAEKNSTGKWHCFSHAYRVNDPKRGVMRHHCGDEGLGGEGTGRLLSDLLRMSRPVADGVILATMWCERGGSAPGKMGVAAPQICSARSLLERMGFRSCFERGAIAECPSCKCRVQATRVTDTLKCWNGDCEFKQHLQRLQEEQPPPGTDPGSHAFRVFEKEARAMGERLYGSNYDPDAALTRLRERKEIGLEMDPVEQLRELMLRMQIRPIHSISGIWLQKHQLLLGTTNAVEATEERRHSSIDDDRYAVEECSKKQTKMYNPTHPLPLSEAVPPPRAERERTRQQMQQQTRSGRTKPGQASPIATGRGRRHFDPYPMSKHKHDGQSDTTDGTQDAMCGAVPDEEDHRIALVSRPA